MEEEKKEYGGCLSILLPIWVIGQILSLVINLTTAWYFKEQPIIPILFIIGNIIALIGIILLLKFKKIGFYIFTLTYVIFFFVSVIFPDYVDDNAAIKSAFGLILFFILMSIKNKDTKLNGFQTLGLFNSKKIKDNVVVQDNTTPERDAVKQGNRIDDKNGDNKTNDKIEEKGNKDKEDDYGSVRIFYVNDEEEENPDTPDDTEYYKKYIDVNNIVNNNSNRPKKKSKSAYILISICIIIFLALVILLFTKENKTDEEIYNDAVTLIEDERYDEGIKKLNKIKDNYPPAKSLLGCLYYYEKSVGINKELGEKLLWEAYENNDSAACAELFDIYMEKGDWDMSNKIATKFVDIDFTEGTRNIVSLYFDDNLGAKKNTHQDYTMAEYYALKIAEEDPYSSFCLGVIYFKGGKGVEKDYNKSFYWWKNGADLGDAACFNNIGWCYSNGKGVNRNYKKAYESYKESIRIEPSGDAYKNLALMFRDGRYVKFDRDSVKFYLQKAKENGNEDALVWYENEFN